MPQSLSKITLHLVFSTKNRVRMIDENIREELYSYIGGICKKLNSYLYRVGGTDDHIHITCTLPRTLTVSKLLEEIKKSSSAWIKTQGDAYNGFSWQAGYGVFSVGQSQLPALLNYIDGQLEHHRTQTFEEELRAILGKYGVEYDERYVWD